MMGRRPKVLIVDSDISICLFVTTALQKAGYDTDIALSGQDGLAKIADFRPECLILDALLADISGYAVCRRVRQSFPKEMMRILLMSSKDAPLDKRYGLRQGADSYLLKPFTVQTLLQEIGRVTPEAVRNATYTATAIAFKPQPRVSLTLQDLIPRRLPDQEVMRASSPFVNTVTMKNEHARRLYNAIDGRKTVTDLAAVTGLEAKEIFRLLGEFLEENYVQIYDSAGQLIEHTLLLSTFYA